jgi:hypothetical protein
MFETFAYAAVVEPHLAGNPLRHHRDHERWMSRKTLGNCDHARGVIFLSADEVNNAGDNRITPAG